jgi:hypothetical protein
MDKKQIHLLVLGLVAGVATANLIAAEEPDTSSDQVPEANLKELTDPTTILTRRVWLETEWNKFTDGTHVVEETSGTLWAWRVSENQDWAVRLKLPVKFRVGSDVPGVADIGGFGDVKVATGTAFLLSKTTRIGAGPDLGMPTGRHELSDNAWRIQEFGAFAWDIPHGSPSVPPLSTTNQSPRKAVRHRYTSWRRSFRSPLFFRTNGRLAQATKTRRTLRTTTTSRTAEKSRSQKNSNQSR